MVQENEMKKDNLYKMSNSVLLALQKDIQEIKAALLGNEYNPEGGLLCRTASVERELDRLKNRYEKMMWTAAGAGTGASFVIAVIVWIIENLSK